MGRLSGLRISHDEDGDDDHHQGLDIKPNRPNGKPYEQAYLVLPQQLISNRLPASLLRALRTGGMATFTLLVPESWMDNIERGLKEIGDAVHVVVCRAKQNDGDQLTGIKAVGSGRPVVYLASDIGHVPVMARNMSSDTYGLHDVDAKSLQATLRRCSRGRVPSAYAPDLGTVALPLICAAIVTGVTVHRAMDTLDRLAAAAKAIPEQDADVPPLLECVEYGPLVPWGLRLGEDLNAWKENRLAGEDLDASILLVSKPGMGKTFFTRILSKHLDVPIFRLGIGELMHGDGYLHTTLKNMTTAFENARRQAPSILFLDEVDNFQRRSSDGHRNDQYFNTVVNHLLVLMDGGAFRNHGVVLIGATNRPEIVDPAICRPGRLSKTIVVPPLDSIAREHILRTHLQGCLVDVSLTEAVARLAGTTPAEVMQVVREAKALARSEGRELCMDHLLSTVRSDQDLDPEVRKQIAAHEAGHATCAVLLQDDVITLVSASLERSGSSGGHTAFADLAGGIETSQTHEHRTMVLLAGRAAEAVLLGSEPSTGAGGDETSDLALATKLITASYGSLGLFEQLSWRSAPGEAMKLLNQDPDLRRAVEGKLQAMMTTTKALLERNRPSLQAVADHLVMHGHADAKTIFALVHRANRGKRPVAEIAVQSKGDQQ